MIIETKNLTHKYAVGTPFEKVALEDINLQVTEGDYVGIIGHTGSGKSTLISHLNAILRPTEGQILVDGTDLWDCSKAERIATRFKVGLVFQYPEYQLFEETVYKDIAFGPKNMGLSEDEIDRRVRESLAFVGMGEEYLERSPFELSGGQKRRVAIAGVMALEPKVLVLDEPAAGLDPKGRDEILGRLREYHAQTHSTVLLVSHSMEDIAQNANTVVVMEQGRLKMHAPVSEVFARADELTAMGLDVPQITRVFFSLKEKGYDVRTDIYTIEGAKKEILSRLSKGVGK